MRSKLFVPGSRPELFAKALSGPADALSFDLEDAVAPSRKAEAREHLARMLADPQARASGKTLIVRVNALDSGHFYADVQAVVRPGLHLVNLPKAESEADVVAAASAIEQARAANGVDEPVGLLLNIESPRALRRAASLAAAHPSVAGLQLGLGDLFEPAGINRRQNVAVQQAMFALRMAAAEAGVFAYDSAFANIEDEAGFRAEAELARSLGYLGKSCIHPRQVPLVNAAFRPTDDEIAHARRVVQAASEASDKGVAAFVVDGRMIDGPFLRRAEAILRSASELGLNGAEGQ
ncbi:citryl-CoA lyase [Achromobacter piechaudii]|uniref:Citrate lyase subunit beta n=1 Tax=Achromobacter piechaudii TaxID=72556 RepID=A0ABM8KXC2_9BURK|nr:CoA ester lyase [Achromobacter piechaudii]KNY08866.1 citryl-CoA lyase [Achromobacter piechaudii]CAB3700445.1 Citrate lyase subunit beta [Achromobacter piechaudii]CAB3851998.1 Citrate lyase subunit beta [Achromobacter piechaudii]CAB3950819.1 Citrate lyase subunit beta [Achromobacter piechaudii]